MKIKSRLGKYLAIIFVLVSLLKFYFPFIHFFELVYGSAILPAFILQDILGLPMAPSTCHNIGCLFDGDPNWITDILSIVMYYFLGLFIEKIYRLIKRKFTNASPT